MTHRPAGFQRESGRNPTGGLLDSLCARLRDHRTENREPRHPLVGTDRATRGRHHLASAATRPWMAVD